MKKYEKNFLNAINGGSNAFDFASDNADAAPPMLANNGAKAAAIKGNPAFASTFNLTFLSKYFTLNSGTYTSIAASALNAGLKSDLPFFIFGNNDYEAGFKKIKGEFVINSNWTYGIPFIFGVDSDEGGLALDATVTGALQTGDLIIPFTSALPGTGTTTLALNIVRCPEVAYGSLLSMLSSDRFIINGVRYVLSDVTKIAQFTRQLQFNNLSIFGKFSNDKLTPNDYKVPEQFQDGIIDIPIAGLWGGIDKHKSWGFFNLFDNVEQSWTIFCQTVDKLSA
jgi:hypothetical protein